MRNVRARLFLFATGASDNDQSFLPKRKLAELATTPNSRSSGGDVDGFFASGSSPEDDTSGGTGGYKAREGRAGGGAALTPVVKRRAILYDRGSPDNGSSSSTTAASSTATNTASASAATAAASDASMVDTEAAAMAASALLAVRSSDGPKRWVGAWHARGGDTARSVPVSTGPGSFCGNLVCHLVEESLESCYLTITCLIVLPFAFATAALLFAYVRTGGIGRDAGSPPAPANMSLVDFCRSSPSTTLMS